MVEEIELTERLINAEKKLQAYETLFSCVSQEFYKYCESLKNDIEKEINKSIKNILIQRKKRN